MFSILNKIIPSSWVVRLWRDLPLPKWVRQKIIWTVNHKFLVAILGIIQNENGEVLLLHHTYRDEPWGIPGGWMEREQPAEGLTRELYEETGLQVTVDQLLRATCVGDPYRIDLLFSGRVVGGTFRECAEISEYGFFAVGCWPPGMPLVQQLLIEQVLAEDRMDQKHGVIFPEYT